MRAAMGEAALRLAGAIGYQSAGTVEFLVDDATREFFFLEVNTRLQVEHSGDRGRDRDSTWSENSSGWPPGAARLRPGRHSILGHAIEARLCAEDPAAASCPRPGRWPALRSPRPRWFRWDSGVGPGSRVTVEFDPLLAKVIAHAPTRADAASALAAPSSGCTSAG